LTPGLCFSSRTPSALRFYTEILGFKLDWSHQVDGRPFVVQVSLFGFPLILNQEEDSTVGRAGHGRVFIAVYQHQLEPFRRYLSENNIKTTVLYWGAPTLAIRDLDGNELFTWLPERRANGRAWKRNSLALKPRPDARIRGAG
jgi:catechol 2,3-dioxygenase-like lactoylglutathione lyase family enzyme